jgi:hypothetical protein
MKYPIGAMTLGDILDRGLKLLMARLPAFLAINLVIQLPLLAIELVQVAAQTSEAGIGVNLLLVLVLVFLAIVLTQIASAAILHIISREFVDQPTTVGEAVNFAMGRFGRLIGASILAGIIIGFGMLLLVIPGLIFFTWYALVAQVVVVENRGGGDALARSKQLTEGYRWRVFGVIFVVGLVIGLMQLAIGLALTVVTGPTYEVILGRPGTFELPKIVYHPGAMVVHTIVNFLVQVVLGAYSAICVTLLYFDLRIRKEGFDLELAAKQQVPMA